MSLAVGFQHWRLATAGNTGQQANFSRIKGLGYGSLAINSSLRNKSRQPTVDWPSDFEDIDGTR